jgi:hypothetical protein
MKSIEKGRIMITRPDVTAIIDAPLVFQYLQTCPTNYRNDFMFARSFSNAKTQPCMNEERYQDRVSPYFSNGVFGSVQPEDVISISEDETNYYSKVFIPEGQKAHYDVDWLSITSPITGSRITLV